MKPIFEARRDSKGRNKLKIYTLEVVFPNRTSSEHHQTCLFGRVATEEDEVKSQIAQKDNPLDGFIEVVDVFLKINFHHTSLTSMAYSLYKMNKGLNFFEELMRASFQY